MISDYKKNSKFRKKCFNTQKFRIKTIAKMEKEKKILSIIQYKQYSFRCYEFIEKNDFLHSKVKISTKFKNKKFKNIKRKFVLIKKITPEKLLMYLQNNEIPLIIEDINRFSGSLEAEKYDDVHFYINKCLDFFDELQSSDYFCNMSINIAKADFLSYSYNFEHFFYSHLVFNLHSVLIDMFQSYMDDLMYFPKKFYDIATDSVSKTSMSINLNLPKADMIIKKFKASNNNYYSKIDDLYSIFHINTINEFIDTLVYFLIYHNITIKECKHCHRLFIPSRKDAVFCKNPSPEKPKRTCQDIRTHFSKTQTKQNAEIQALYDKFETMCCNNKKKNPEYNLIWENYKKQYRNRMEDIYHFKLKRSYMIKWHEKLFKNPSKLLTEEKEFNDDNFDITELNNKLINESKNIIQ